MAQKGWANGSAGSAAASSSSASASSAVDQGSPGSGEIVGTVGTVALGSGPVDCAARSMIEFRADAAADVAADAAGIAAPAGDPTPPENGFTAPPPLPTAARGRS